MARGCGKCIHVWSADGRQCVIARPMKWQHIVTPMMMWIHSSVNLDMTKVMVVAVGGKKKPIDNGKPPLIAWEGAPERDGSLP